MDELVDQALATGGEAVDFDFKQALDPSTQAHQVKLLKAIAAFSNTDRGGYVFLGITDRREVVGLSDSIFEQYDQTRIVNLIRQYLAPPPNVQVRQHSRGQHKLVVLEVAPFSDIPHVFKATLNAGRVSVSADSIVTRTSGAESAVLTTEAEMANLCDAIVVRRARKIAELLHRAQPTTARRSNESDSHLARAKQIADSFWPPSARGFIQTGFDLNLDRPLRLAELTELIPGAVLGVRDGSFPFTHVSASQQYTQMPWGWLGVIPFTEVPDPESPPSYLWLLTRDGCFINREYLWEPESDDFKNAVGQYHVLGRLVLTTRFLLRVCTRLELPPSQQVTLFALVHGAAGKYFRDEHNPYRRPFLNAAIDDQLSAEHNLPVSLLQEAPEEAVTHILEEVAWLFRNESLTRQHVAAMVQGASRIIGPEFKFDGGLTGQ